VFQRSIQLIDDELVGVVGTHHPLADRDQITPENFIDTDYVTYSTTPEDGFEFDGFLGPAGVVPATITRVESISAIAAFVAVTQRVTILCRRAVPKRPDLRTLTLAPTPPAPTWTMTVTDSHLSQAIETTVNLIATRWSSSNDAN
jgi:DNA-binding transcriptional LysR family regulator